MRTNKFHISNIILRIFTFLWAVSILFPLLWTLYVSLKSNQEFFQNIWALPKSLHFDNYERAFNKLGIGASLLNTVYYVGLSMIIGITLTTLCAYCLTRLKWKGRSFVWATVMISLFLPGINALVPQYIIMCKAGLSNSLSGLVFLNSVGMSAFDLMLLGGFMKTIPTELEESAFMDGATLLKTFRSIIVPLSVPGIVTISIFRFLGLYNDFLGPYIYLSEESKYVIGQRMYYANIAMQYDNDWTGLFAGVVIAMIPSIIIYLMFQKKIVEGATLGAVKG